MGRTLPTVPAAAAALAALLAVLLLAALLPGRADAAPLRDPQGQPLAVPSSPGVQEATWSGKPVLVFAVRPGLLSGPAATASIPAGGPGDLRVFALSATSTHLGCTVGFLPTLGADRDGDGEPDGLLLDRCHQGSWDPFNGGVPLRGAAPTRLAALVLEERGGRLVSFGFDGPVGATR